MPKLLSVLIIIVIVALLIYLGAVIFWYLAAQKGKPEAIASREQNEWLIPDFKLAEYQVWNRDANFFGLSFSTGDLRKAIYFGAVDTNSWGVTSFAWSFTQPHIPINRGKVAIENDTVYVYAQHSKGRSFGISTLNQGNIWATPESTKWHCPKPLSVNKKVVLDFEVCVEEASVNHFVGPFNWLMMGVNVWYRSPKLSKPIVMDLMFYLYGGVVWTKEDDVAYHYQYVIDRGKDNLGQWKRFSIDLNWFVDKALKRFNIEYAKDDLEIVEIDILIETMYGRGAFRTNRFGLYYKEKK